VGLANFGSKVNGLKQIYASKVFLFAFGGGTVV
jgi:hypothetical protein